MESRTPPRSLEELVDRFDHAAKNNHQVSLDLMMDEVGRRSFGPLLLVAGLVMAAPGVGDIPGVPVILGLFVLIIAVQMLFGHEHFWLPQWLLRRSADSDKVKKMADKWMRRPARFIDRFLKRRMEQLVGKTGVKAIAVACALLALTTPVAEFIPFSANGVGAAISIFGFALIAHDGLVALMGWIVIALTVGLAAYSSL